MDALKGKKSYIPYICSFVNYFYFLTRFLYSLGVYPV